MNLLVIGATPRALTHVKSLVPSGVSVVDAGRPDWIIVATAAQRSDAITTHGLPPYRVVEVPALASDDEIARSSELLRVTLTKMGEIGASRPLISSMGIAIVSPFVRRRVAAAAVSIVPDAVPDATTGMIMSSVPGRMPAGQSLDDHLASRARDRARRFAALAVRRPDRSS